MNSLRSALNGIGAGHLPPGYKASQGVKTLFPPGYKGSISALDGYVATHSGAASLSSPDDYAKYFVGADGSGNWFVSWAGFPNTLGASSQSAWDDYVTGNVPEANIRLQAIFIFLSKLDVNAHGYVDGSRPGYGQVSCAGGNDAWIRENWVELLPSGLAFDYQQASGFDSLPDASNCWTSEGYGASNYTQLTGGSVKAAATSTGSALFTAPTPTPDMYVSAIAASAQARALSQGASVTVDVAAVESVVKSANFRTTAAPAVLRFLTSSAGPAAVADAKIIAAQLVHLVNPQSKAVVDAKALSSALTAARVLAAAQSAGIALGTTVAIAGIVADLKSGLSKASDVVDKVIDAAAEAVNEAAVNSGGNLEEMPLEIVVDMAGWVASNLIVTDDGVSASPSTPPDPSTPPADAGAGDISGTPDPDAGDSDGDTDSGS